MALKEVFVPDIGDFKDVPIIEMLVKAGDTVKAEESLFTVESDKATMEIPAPISGVVKELKVKIGDVVNTGMLIAVIDEVGAAASAPQAVAASPAPAVAAPAPAPAAAPAPAPAPAAPVTQPAESPTAILAPATTAPGERPHASPSVRKFARELGVDIARVSGNGPKGRILHEDVQNFVKQVMSGAAAAPASAPARRCRRTARRRRRAASWRQWCDCLPPDAWSARYQRGRAPAPSAYRRVCA